MKQKIEDLKLLLQNDKRLWVAFGIIALMIIFTLFSNNSSLRMPRPSTVANNTGGNQGADSNEAYRDLTMAFRQDIETLSKQSQQNTEVMNKLSNDLADHKARATGVFESLTNKLEEVSREMTKVQERSASIPDTSGSGNGGSGEAALGGEADSLEAIGFQKATVPPPPAPDKPLRMSVISPGDVVPVKLLTGVNAPVDGTPYPVVFKLDGPITGPDGSSLDIGEARLIAAAQGSEADSRALFRFTNLSLRHKDGRRSNVKVDGWVVGEDGVRGMSGELIDKLGRLIAATAGVSFAAALGERVENAGKKTIIQPFGYGYAYEQTYSGKALDFAGASAVTDAANRLGQILLDRYEKLIPVVEILPGRQVVAVFSSSTEIEMIDDDSEGEGIYAASSRMD
ncbi:TraB/VirB10 family protein [bacterium]|nr:TraB/VirB10 family protein [bacterium]